MMIPVVYVWRLGFVDIRVFCILYSTDILHQGFLTVP